MRAEQADGGRLGRGAAAATLMTQFAIAAAVGRRRRHRRRKANVKNCIQVLGGIGFTWEHDAHLYLRRAHSIGRFLGGAERLVAVVTALT